MALAADGDKETLGLGYIFGGAALTTAGISVALALVAGTIDWFTAVHRDAFHWVGILAFAIALAHGLAEIAG